MFRQHSGILPMCLRTRATALTNSVFPPAAGRCGPKISRTDAFLDHRLAAISVRNSTGVFQEEARISRPELAKAVRVDHARRVWTYIKSVLGELHTLKIYIEFALSFQWVRHFVTDRKAGNPRLNREISMADPIRDR